MNTREWIEQFRSMWKQGEHVVIVGPTGTGKTTLAAKLLTARRYVCVLAVKRNDDTIEAFRKQHFKVIHKWPPQYSDERVVLWIKPKTLNRLDLEEQSEAIHKALSEMYISGGYCIYFDEAGYVAGQLGLARDLAILLNQGRSSYLSVVTTMTRPTSVTARVPKEAFNQARHKLLFPFADIDEIKSCARIASLNWQELRDLMSDLKIHQRGYSDFLYINQSRIEIIRN